jgi:hypothetical protein
VAGWVVVINGTSSSGKSTVVNALRDLIVDECWLATGIDVFLAIFPGIWFTVPERPGPHGAAGFSFLPDGGGALIVTPGPAGERLLAGYRRSVAALAHAATTSTRTKSWSARTPGRTGRTLCPASIPSGCGSSVRWTSASNASGIAATGSSVSPCANMNAFTMASDTTSLSTPQNAHLRRTHGSSATESPWFAGGQSRTPAPVSRGGQRPVGGSIQRTQRRRSCANHSSALEARASHHRQTGMS